MSDTIEDRLRAHYDRRTADLPDRGPGPGEMRSTSMYTIGDGRPEGRRRTAVLAALTVGSAAAAVVIGLALVGGTAGDDEQIDPQTAPPTAVPEPDAEALAPVATLPMTSDVFATPPPTVVGTGPTDWYRLAPDLDVAWYQNGTEPSMLCLRTPTEETCRVDEFALGQPVTALTAGGQMLVVVLGDQSESTAQVELSDGTVRTAPIAWDSQIGWGIIRIAADDVSVTGVYFGETTLAAADGLDAPLPSATLAPAADLVETPITIPEGQGLA